MLILNLVGVLLLLIEARRRWFGRASDEAIKRREERKNLLVCLGFFAWIYAGIPVLSVKLRINAVMLFWGPILIPWAIVAAYQRVAPIFRREWYRADYLRYHGGPLDGRPLMWPGRDEPMWCGVVDSAHCLLPRIDANGGYYELNREKARYEWQQDYGPPLIEAHLPPEHRAQHAQPDADPERERRRTSR